MKTTKHSDLERINIMKKETRKVGDEVLVNGFWVSIVELCDDGYAFVMDQDGKEFEVYLD